MTTHEVLNQTPALVDYNLFASDPVLVELVKVYDAGWAEDRLNAFGQFAGSAQAISWAEQANNNKPVLKTHDRFGHRLDEVEYHPAYHSLVDVSIKFGLHNSPWREPRAGAHVARAALMYMSFQNEAGHCCPVSMTYSAMPSLKKDLDLTCSWRTGILSTIYDSRFCPPMEKTGLTIGMGMTEKQGGSDVRANTTIALPVSSGSSSSGSSSSGSASGSPSGGSLLGGSPSGGATKEYRLKGHKWFCSAPMCDAFLVLAQAPKGLSCFLVPRWKPDGTKNNFFIQRLKNKLGNHSNASSEVEFDDTFAWLINEEGRGVPTIIEMVNHTRLDCMLGSAGLMHQASLQALHHCHHRSTFGKKLSEHPLMLNVLADLVLEAEAALHLAMRVASAYDKVDNEREMFFKRIACAIGKYWTCKRCPQQVVEALECLGGNGYVEDSPMPRLFRESPLPGIWEGSGNVICLDVLRAAKEPVVIEALMSELDEGQGACKKLDAFVKASKRSLNSLLAKKTKASTQNLFERELTARAVVEKLALALQAQLLVKQAPDFVADAFISSRIAGKRGLAFGTLDKSCRVADIVARAYSF